MGKNVTMRDIASKLDVSVVTVSKALSGKEGVSDEVREMVKQVAEDMGYQYNKNGKKKEVNTNRNVGIIIAQRFFESSSFYADLYRNIVLSLTRTRYFGVLEIITQKQEENLVMPNLFSSNSLDGILVIGQIKYDYLNKILEKKIPYVLVDFNNEEGLDCIVSDNIYGSYCLTNYLISNGHTQIGFVGSVQATSSIMDRYLGMYKSLLQHGIEFKNEWLIRDRDCTGKFESIKLPENMPTAFVCNCDQVAYGLIQKLKEKGYRVPEDISIVGFDDYIYSTLSKPALTTYHVNVKAMAEISVQSLIKKIRIPSYRTGCKVISGGIVVRDSVRKLQ